MSFLYKITIVYIGDYLVFLLPTNGYTQQYYIHNCSAHTLLNGYQTVPPGQYPYIWYNGGVNKQFDEIL